MRHLLLIISLLLSVGGFAQTNSTETSRQERPVFMYVEQMPAAPYDLIVYIEKNMHYPDSAKAHGTMGRVYIQFIVNEDGSISDCKVVRGIGDGCDEEAKRVICNMPKWKPGKQNGKAVAVRFTTPVTFRIQ